MVLRDVSWKTYEHLLADFSDRSSPRLAFDQGSLEITQPCAEQEIPNRTIALLVETVAEEQNRDVIDLGSTTLRRHDLQQGVDPDTCFYIQNAERIRARTQIDLRTDPPPDLVIEIDITGPSFPKLPIYAQLGIPEVWRYDGQRLSILRLGDGAYHEVDESLALPSLTGSILTGFLEDSETLRRTEWLRKLRDWLRRQH